MVITIVFLLASICLAILLPIYLRKKFRVNVKKPYVCSYTEKYTEKWLTAKQIYELVLKASQCGMEDEIADYRCGYAEACIEKDFPEKYRIAILMLILNSKANIQLRKLQSTDDSDIEICYNSLPSTYESVKKVKDKYLKAVITTIAIKHSLKPRDCTKKEEEWKKAKFDEYASVDSIYSFRALRIALDDDFSIKMWARDSEESCKENGKEIQDFLASIVLE